MKKAASLVLLATFLLLAGCVTHVHMIGNGPSGSTMVQERQWYVLWGLVPINQVDSKAMAAGASDYKIMTQASAVDVVISFFTGIATVNCRTVTVTK